MAYDVYHNVYDVYVDVHDHNVDEFHVTLNTLFPQKCYLRPLSAPKNRESQISLEKK